MRVKYIEEIDAVEILSNEIPLNMTHHSFSSFDNDTLAFVVTDIEKKEKYAEGFLTRDLFLGILISIIYHQNKAS